MFKHRLSPAAAVAFVALFVALGGTSVVASKFLITSTRQIKPSVLKQLSNAVAFVAVASKAYAIPPGHELTAFVQCPRRWRAISGGGTLLTPNDDGLVQSRVTDDLRGWQVAGKNTSDAPGTIQALATCAQPGHAVAAAAGAAAHASVIHVEGGVAPGLASAGR